MKEALVKILSKFRPHQEKIILAFILTATLLAHAVNVFNYPAYQEDEGTYVSQAWSLVTQGKLAPYTYWYDHAPFGWIFMSLWNILTQGFFTFGMSINSGRLFMILISVASTFFLYKIVKNLTGYIPAATIAALIFALSPLSILFQRRVFLDNIMVFWFLISLFFLTFPFRLRNIIVSSITFALAVLTKETMVIFLPIFTILVYAIAHKNNRSFATISYLFVAFFIVSLYPLLALLKGEFFPTGTLLGGDQPHVSILQTIDFQARRVGGFFLSRDSSFMQALTGSWLRADSFFVFLGGAVSIANILFFRTRWIVFISATTLIYILYLIRGGVVLDLYIIPLLPLFALNIGLFISEIHKVFASKFQINNAGLIISGLLILLITFQLRDSIFLWTANQTVNQVLAVQWIKENIPSDSLILIDNYAYVDLNSTNLNNSDKLFGPQYYLKMDSDPEIKYEVIRNDWHNIDYLLVTPAFRQTMNDQNLEIVQQAYTNSTPIVTFSYWDGKSDPYPVEIRKVNNNRTKSLSLGWEYYKKTFINEQGKTTDLYSGDTTSEGQAYALLRAVWSNDKPTFDRTLNWTVANLKIPDRNIFSWLYGDVNGTFQIKDRNSASDADEDIALALLFAHKRWDDPAYLLAAQAIVNDIWENEVVQIGGRYYLVSGTGAEYPEGYTVNPSYFSPAAYRIFAQIDPNHPWNQLADDSYITLDQLQRSNFLQSKKSALPPNWIVVKSDGSGFASAQNYFESNKDTNEFGFDAFRVFWRVALDAAWFHNSEAKNYLEKVQPFILKQVQTQQDFVSVYNLDGTPAVNYSRFSTDAGPLSVLLITNPDIAKFYYYQTLGSNFNLQGYWGDDKINYYDQNWAWFATALYTNMLPNLWATNQDLE